MKLRSVTAAYFSPTGNARRIVTAAAETVSGKTGVPFRTIDFTLPRERRAVHRFEAGDLLVIGTPVYAGRIPNKILPAIQTLFEGNGALAVPVMTFGNRSFDNGLIEMRNELEQHGFHTIAGAAFVSEHVMSDKLAGGRPDAEDFQAICRFALDVAAKIDALQGGTQRRYGSHSCACLCKGERIPFPATTGRSRQTEPQRISSRQNRRPRTPARTAASVRRHVPWALSAGRIFVPSPASASSVRPA